MEHDLFGKPVSTFPDRALSLHFLRRRFLGRRRRKIGFTDPAGFHPRLHHQAFGVLARQLETVENAGFPHRLAVLALGPASEVVGRATSQVLDRLDAVLAEADQHRRGDARHLFQLIGDAELRALGVELGLDLGQIIARPRLQLGRGILVEAFDAGDLFGVDHRQLLDRS